MNNISQSVKSINPWQSVIQTIYNIVKAHGRKIKEDEANLLYNYLLSESQINGIKRLHR